MHLSRWAGDCAVCRRCSWIRDPTRRGGGGRHHTPGSARRREGAGGRARRDRYWGSRTPAARSTRRGPPASTMRTLSCLSTGSRRRSSQRRTSQPESGRRCRTVSRPAQGVGWSVIAPRPGRSARCSASRSPARPTGPSEGRPARRAPSWHVARPKAMGANSKTGMENNKNMKNRRSTTRNAERTKDTDTKGTKNRKGRSRSGRRTGRDARRIGVEHVLRTMPSGWHPAGRLCRRTSSSLLGLRRTLSTEHPSLAIHPVLSDDRSGRDATTRALAGNAYATGRKTQGGGTCRRDGTC